MNLGVRLKTTRSMSDQTTVREPSALEVLEDRLRSGKTLSTRAELAGGQVRMWTGSVKAAMRRLFGPESEAFAAWPAADAPFTPALTRETLNDRLARLQCLIDAISESSLAALTRPTPDRVFIGHGRSPLWRELKDFLQDRLALKWEEFNRSSVAGIATTERLVEMLNSATFAFLVMTAEDEHADATLHARENVVHEVGLFQGRLGMQRAIVLVEEGCHLFSNIHGLSYIGFPRGRISACFEEIRRVLEREGLVAS